MRLADLITGSGCTIESGAADALVAGVTDDSREVRPGFLFIARPGAARDGAEFLADAIRAGATAALAPRGGAPLTGAPPGFVTLRADDAADAGARLIERFAGDPSSKLAVAGVTGTNGKTTTCFLTHALLEAAGLKPALVTTVALDDGAQREKAVMTTPGAGAISALLARAVANRCASAVVETSSHALDQRRVVGLHYRVGVFTNLSGDHLDYHKTMEAYADAKARLFERLPDAADGGVAVVNADDPWSIRMLRDCPARVVACSTGGGGLRDIGAGAARAFATVHATTMRGMDASLTGPWGAIDVRIPLVGAHNAMNALQAAAAAHALGANAEAIAKGLANAPSPPGRLEPVRPRGAGGEPFDAPFAVFVDYAHTDDALRRALSAMRPLVGPGGRLLCAFGAGGDKDRTKRPRMGLAVAQLADVPIVTSDNPRTEKPESIIEMILAGMDAAQRSRVVVQPDRERAIREAIAGAREGDILVIAGKGHEDYQILPDGKGGTIRRDFDDRLIARAALEERFGGAARSPASRTEPTKRPIGAER